MDQLEIIGSNGKIEFYELNPAKGITNIGRHPENDIVLDGPGIALFHAMLDHRQKPYQIMLLSQEETTLLGGAPLIPNVSMALHSWTNITVANFTIILIEDGNQSPPSPGGTKSNRPPTPTPPPILPPRPAPTPPPNTRPESAAPSSHPVPASFPETGKVSSFPAPISDQEDDFIITELSQNEWTIDVTQTVTFEVIITNGGDIVAEFRVDVEGLNPEWITISYPHWESWRHEQAINLNEGGQGRVSISITPPRLSSSRAGAHYFAVSITSSNYPSRVSRRGATLIINPYYEFTLAELAPKEQTISWFKRTAQVQLPIFNKGNSNAIFNLKAAEREQGCNFEFHIPDDDVKHAMHAELPIEANSEIAIPITVTPHAHRLIGFRKKSYALTVTTSLAEGVQAPRSLLGQLRTKPLIGPWLLLLMALLFVCLCLVLLTPRLNTFMFTDGGTVAAVSNETPVAIRWGAYYFTTLSIDPPIEGLEQPLKSRQGTVVAAPKEDTTYYLSGENFLSRLAPVIFAPATKAVEVRVTPIAPQVTFEAQPAEVVSDGNEEVVLSWWVTDADNIKLYRQVGADGPVEEIGDYSEQPIQSLRVTPDPNRPETFYILVVGNSYVSAPTPVSQRVSVLTPTPTAPATPVVLFFNANPQNINEGDESALSWSVNGVQEVTIQGIDNASSLPSEYIVAVQPTGSTDYFLSVAGLAPLPVRVNVTPATPTPTATTEPGAPEIIVFSANPDSVVEGDVTQSTLSWTIDDNFTNGEITNSDIGTVPFTDQQGSLNVSISNNAIFVLTAYNQDKQTSKSIEVGYATPTPTTTPTPTPTTAPTSTSAPTSTATPTPPSILFYNPTAASGSVFSCSQDSNNDWSCTIEMGSTLTVDWEVSTDATDINIKYLGTVGTTGPDVIDPGSSQGGSYTGFRGTDAGAISLTASHSYGSATRTITVTVVAKAVPSPPTNFQGPTSPTATAPYTLTWSAPAQNSANVVNYKVYRAEMPPGTSFSEVVTLSALTTTDTPPDCSKNYIYNVVALYEDIDGNEQETAAGSPSWSSPGVC